MNDGNKCQNMFSYKFFHKISDFIIFKLKMLEHKIGTKLQTFSRKTSVPLVSTTCSQYH